MRKILVPTDFSPNAVKAFCYAVPFAALFKADVVVAHVIKRPTLPANSPLEVYETVMEEEKARAWEEMRKQVDQKKEALPTDQTDVRVIPVIISNAFVQGVNQLVAQENTSLVIMGTKGATGLKRLFVGSNTTDLLEHATVPVLAVPEKSSFKDFRNIVLALSLRDLKEMEPLHLLRTMVERCASSVTVLTVISSGEAGLAGAEEQKARVEQMLGPFLKWVEVKSRNPVKAIQEFVESHATDLLVLMPQPKSIWHQLFGTSVTYEIVFKPEIPVLVIPDRTQDHFRS